MTSATYSIYLNNPFGQRLAILDRWASLEYSLVVNDVGALTLTLSPGVPLPAACVPDGIIEVWRRLPGGREYLEADRIWFIQAPSYSRGGDGLVSVTLECVGPLWLLDEPGRFVDAAAGTSGATKTDYADDMIKDVVRENAGSSASAARQVPGLSVAADTGQAPSISKAFAWKPVLQVLREIAAASAQAGTYLAFDLVSVGGAALELQTFVGSRGVDRRAPSSVAPLILGSEFGNLAETVLRTDYAGEITYCKAGGQGDGSARLTATAQDAARTAMTPYRYRETFKDATSYSSATGLSDEAAATVRAGRPRVVLSGKVQSTAGCEYGIHWGWGDYVTVQEFGAILDARIDAVSVKITGDTEDVNAVVRAETYL